MWLTGRPALPICIAGDASTGHPAVKGCAMRESTCAEMRVALFITCFNDTLFPQTGQAVVRLLERLGHEVVFPEEQTCCGQMHFQRGYREEAAVLARRFVDVFEGHETIVCPSASC